MTKEYFPGAVISFRIPGARKSDTTKAVVVSHNLATDRVTYRNSNCTVDTVPASWIVTK